MDEAAESQKPIFLSFETSGERDLTLIPMAARMRLDICGLKLGLEQWSSLPRADRERMLTADCETAADGASLQAFILLAVLRAGAGEVQRISADLSWRETGQVPNQVTSSLKAIGSAPIDVVRWGRLTDLQRFALLKLSRPGHTRNLPAALREFSLFGVLESHPSHQSFL